MATVRRDDLREQLQLRFEDLALRRGEHLKLVLSDEEERRWLESMWRTFELGELPVYEPEIRLRKVAG